VLGRFLERIFFAIGQVALFALGEAENEDGKSAFAEKDDRSVSLGFSSPGRATLCFMTPAPRLASTTPLVARPTASRNEA
jgi:hypothetical protein